MASSLFGNQRAATPATLNNGVGALNPQAAQAIRSVKQMMSMLGAVQNPQAALMEAARQNPALGSVMQMIGGRNPKDVFYEKCKEMGVDPETVISQLR